MEAKLMTNESMMMTYEQPGNFVSRIICNGGSSDANVSKRVEAALYDYPVWKVNSEQIQSLPDDNGNLSEDATISYQRSLEELIVKRNDYVSQINLIEATMNVLSPLQQAFVQQRYFKKTPFKVIAEELAVTERHLYRIRQEVIRLFEISFGWL